MPGNAFLFKDNCLKQINGSIGHLVSHSPDLFVNTLKKVSGAKAQKKFNRHDGGSSEIPHG